MVVPLVVVELPVVSTVEPLSTGGVVEAIISVTGVVEALVSTTGVDVADVVVPVEIETEVMMVEVEVATVDVFVVIKFATQTPGVVTC